MQLKKINPVSIAYGLIMFIIVNGSSQNMLVKASFWDTLYASLSNSTIIELTLFLGFFVILGYASIFIVNHHIESAFKISRNYGSLTILFVGFTYALFFSEVFDFYWISIETNFKFASMLMSSLFFSPIFILATNIIQKIYVYIYDSYGIKHSIAYDKNKDEFYVKSEIDNDFSINYFNDIEFIKKIEAIYTELRIKEENWSHSWVYDKEGRISSEWTEKISEGHWVTVYHDQKGGLKVRHKRSNENGMSKSFDQKLIEEQEYNSKTIWSDSKEGLNEKDKANFYKKGSLYIPKN